MDQYPIDEPNPNIESPKPITVSDGAPDAVGLLPLFVGLGMLLWLFLGG